MRAARRLALLTGSVVAALTIGGCGGSSPAGTAPSVPPIDNPKDASGVNPCTLLAPEQLERISRPGVPGRNDLGPQCVWRGAGSKKVTLTLFTSGEGLTTLARNSDPAASRVRVQGYPALETFTADGRYCQYDIAIAPDQALVATMTGGKPNSCAALQELLPTVLDSLPPYRR